MALDNSLRKIKNRLAANCFTCIKEKVLLGTGCVWRSRKIDENLLRYCSEKPGKTGSRRFEYNFHRKLGFGIYENAVYFLAPQTCKKPRNFLGFLMRYLFCSAKLVDDVGLELQTRLLWCDFMCYFMRFRTEKRTFCPSLYHPKLPHVTL